MRLFALTLLLLSGPFHGASPRAPGQPPLIVRETAVASWSNALSVNFDGSNDHAVCGQPADIVGINHAATGRTYSVWAKPNAATVDATFFSVAEQTNRPVQLYSNSGQPTAFIGSNTMAYGVAMTSGTWYHLVITTNGAASTKLYVNGVDRATTTAGTVATALDVLMGARRNSGNTGTAWLGACNVDEVTVWDVGFSAGEVTALYNAGDPANPAEHSRAANLIHYWPMGDGDTYPTLADLIGVADCTMTTMASNDIEEAVP